MPRSAYDRDDSPRPFAPRVRVRCMGPNPKTHYFMSTHPTHRVCADCRRTQDRLGKLEKAQTTDPGVIE